VVDLGRPPNFGGSEGVVELFAFGEDFRFGPVAGAQIDLLTTDDSPSLYRIRFFSVFGNLTAGAGGVVLTFQANCSAITGDPWPSGGPVIAASDTQVLPTESFHYAWSTEIADNYSNLDSDFGRVWVGGMPLVYLPKQTTISILFTSKGGYGGDFHMVGGHMQMERFQADTVTGVGSQGPNEGVYLLPQVA
jgi:hypothetical protein